MSTIAERLQKWSVQELNLVSESLSESALNRVPDVENLSLITKGKYKRVWTYVINHVRSKATVNKIKRTLYFKKLLEENEEKVVTFNDVPPDPAELQAAITKTKEKRAFLMRSLSTVKERILNLEQKNIKDETLEVNQKAVFLELVKQSYDKKNNNLKDLLSQILACRNALNAYRITNVCDKTAMAFPYDFLFENKAVCDQNRLKELIDICSSIMKDKFYRKNEKDDVLIEKFQKSIFSLKEKGVLLTDLVILLEEMSGSDLQQFASMNVQGSTMKNFDVVENKKNPSKILLTQLKCDNVSNTLISIKNSEEVRKLLLRKEESFKNIKIELSDVDFEIKSTLIEKLAENKSLIISNNYLEDYLNDMSNKTQTVLKKIRQLKLCSEELNSVVQRFYSNADLLFYLLYNFPDSKQEIINNLNKLQLFACNEVFELPFPPKEWLAELKFSMTCDRKLTWEYCDKTSLIQSPLRGLHMTNLSSPEMQKSLNFQPFQNIAILCEYWKQLKWNLCSDIVAQSENFELKTNVSVSELYGKILKMLEVMKASFEEAEIFVSDATTSCHKHKFLIQEWWDQNAQYIPHITHEGKTLKMWIDILSVLTNFEPQSYT